MSAEAIAWVRKHYCPTGRGASSKRFVMVTIAETSSQLRHGDFQSLAESVTTIAAKVCLDERHVRRVIGELEREGVLKVKHVTDGHKFQNNVYQIVVGLQPAAPDQPQARNGSVAPDELQAVEPAPQVRSTSPRLTRKHAIVIDQCPECYETIDRLGAGHWLGDPPGVGRGCPFVGMGPPEIAARAELLGT